MFDPFEYFVLRKRDGLLQDRLQARRWARSRTTSPATRACRTWGRRRARCWSRCPGTEVTTVERCSGPRRHLGREDRIFRQLDEDRPPGVPPDGRTPSPTTSAPIARSPRATSCRAWARRRASAYEGAPADPSTQGLRHLALVVLLGGCAPVSPPPGASFGAAWRRALHGSRGRARRRGDRPDQRRDARLRRARRRHRLGRVRPAPMSGCSRARLSSRASATASSCCRRQRVERLQGSATAPAAWREIFCETPGEFCEHRRWEVHGWVFVALNVAGHDNNVRHARARPRMKRSLRSWTMPRRCAGQAGLMVLMQANPFLIFPARWLRFAARDAWPRPGAATPGQVC